MPTTVNLLDSSAVATALMNAICEQLPPGSPQWDRIVDMQRATDRGVVEITLTLNGVAVVDPVAALTNVLNRELERLNQMASQRALEMVTQAGLDGIEQAMRKTRETMEQADWALRKALRDKAGATFYDDDSR